MVCGTALLELGSAWVCVLPLGLLKSLQEEAMLTWLLVVPAEDSWEQWDGPGKRELAMPWVWGRAFLGLCVSPRGKPSTLPRHCRASTVEGVKTHFLFSRARLCPAV